MSPAGAIKRAGGVNDMLESSKRIKSSSSSSQRQEQEVPKYATKLKEESHKLKPKLEKLVNACRNAQVPTGSVGQKFVTNIEKTIQEHQDAIFKPLCIAVYGHTGAGKSHMVNNLLAVELASSTTTELAKGETTIPVTYRHGDEVKVICTHSSEVLQPLPADLEAEDYHENLSDRFSEMKSRTFQVDVTPEDKSPAGIQNVIRLHDDNPQAVAITVYHPKIQLQHHEGVQVEVMDMPGDFDTSFGKELRMARIEYALRDVDIILLFTPGRSADFNSVMKRLEERFWLHCRNVLPSVGIVVNEKTTSLKVTVDPRGLTRVSKKTENSLTSAFQNDTAKLYGFDFDPSSSELAYRGDCDAMPLPVDTLDKMNMLLQGVKVLCLAVGNSAKSAEESQKELLVQLRSLLGETFVRRENFFTRRACERLKTNGDNFFKYLKGIKKKQNLKADLDSLPDACNFLRDKILAPGFSFLQNGASKRKLRATVSVANLEDQLGTLRRYMDKLSAAVPTDTSTSSSSMTKPNRDKRLETVRSRMNIILNRLVKSLRKFLKMIKREGSKFDVRPVRESYKTLQLLVSAFSSSQSERVQNSKTMEELYHLSQIRHPFDSPQDFLDDLKWFEAYTALKEGVKDLADSMKEFAPQHDSEATATNKLVFSPPRLLVASRTLALPQTASNSLAEAKGQKIMGPDGSLRSCIFGKDNALKTKLTKRPKDFLPFISKPTQGPTNACLGPYVKQRIEIELDPMQQILHITGSCHPQVREKAEKVCKASIDFVRGDSDSPPALFPVVIWTSRNDVNEAIEKARHNIASYVAFVASRRHIEKKDYDIPLLVLLVHQVPETDEDTHELFFGKKQALEDEASYLQNHFETTLGMGSNAGVAEWVMHTLQTSIVEVAVRCDLTKTLGDGRILTISQILCEELLKAPYYHLVRVGSSFHEFYPGSRTFTKYSIFTAARALAFSEKVMWLTNRPNTEESLLQRKIALKSFKKLVEVINRSPSMQKLDHLKLSDLFDQFLCMESSGGKESQLTKTAKLEDEFRAALCKLDMSWLDPGEFQEGVFQALQSLLKHSSTEPGLSSMKEISQFLFTLKEAISQWDFAKQCEDRPDLHPLAQLLGLFFDMPRCAQVATAARGHFGSMQQEAYVQREASKGFEAYMASRGNPTHRVSLKRYSAVLMNSQTTRGIPFVSRETLFEDPPSILRQPKDKDDDKCERDYTRQLLLHGFGGCECFTFMLQKEKAKSAKRNDDTDSDSEQSESE